ncbi:FAD-dependent monooxygenase [Demequina sp. SYSU T00192]|uniref:FAD-dependent monooxygenase n=1 Tax=Demequina litoralis TaxID=3051660 RepID=A0ABT8G9S2_9MICO|nr:FAD-dependent monooxygenase [Demequina sp. SYSU T00192]MDN4475747.1 FAD-dependent monooxygenase [Demequina sp. SYSU T00192]
MTTLDADVVVVGAGPVGMATALGLAHHGVASVLVERRPEPTPESKAFGVWGRTLEALDAWGLAEGLVAAGDPRDTIAPVAVETGRPIFAVDLGSLAAASAMPGFLVLPQSATEAVLREAVEASPLVRMVRGEVTGVRQDDAAVAVAVASLDGDWTTLRAAYAVGADGARSVVRESQGVGTRGRSLAVGLLVCDVEVDGDDALPPVVLAGERPGLLAGLRFGRRRWRVLASLEGRGPVTGDVRDELVRALFGDRAVRITWQSETTPYQHRVPSFRLGRRIVLAGDSAHLVSPAGGQGMNQGIQDAESLAWSLAAALRADAAGDRAGADAMLDGYARERERIADVVARRARVNSALEFRTPPWLRPPAFLAMRVATRAPWFTRMLARRLSMRDLANRSRDSARLAGGQRSGPVGRRVPDVTLPDGRRLSGALAGRASLVAVGCEPPAAPPGLTVVRVEALPLGARLYRGDVAVVRPDRVVGAVLRRPSAEDLSAAVARALGRE